MNPYLSPGLIGCSSGLSSPLTYIHCAGHTPAHNSQPIHFSIPSSYLLSTCLPWNLCGFFLNSFGYLSVTDFLNNSLKVTFKPFTKSYPALIIYLTPR